MAVIGQERIQIAAVLVHGSIHNGNGVGSQRLVIGQLRILHDGIGEGDGFAVLLVAFAFNTEVEQVMPLLAVVEVHPLHDVLDLVLRCGRGNGFAVGQHLHIQVILGVCLAADADRLGNTRQVEGRIGILHQVHVFADAAEYPCTICACQVIGDFVVDGLAVVGDDFGIDQAFVIPFVHGFEEGLIFRLHRSVYDFPVLKHEVTQNAECRSKIMQSRQVA
ncbi:hypothetical protein D3C75_800730 [compost metagenome]